MGAACSTNPCPELCAMVRSSLIKVLPSSSLQAKKAADAPMEVEKDEPAATPAERAGEVGESHAAI